MDRNGPQGLPYRDYDRHSTQQTFSSRHPPGNPAEPFLNCCDGVHMPFFETAALREDAIRASPASGKDVCRSCLSAGGSPRLEMRRPSKFFIAPGRHGVGFIADFREHRKVIVSTNLLGLQACEPLDLHFMNLLAEHDSATLEDRGETNVGSAPRVAIPVYGHGLDPCPALTIGRPCPAHGVSNCGLQMLPTSVLNPGLMPIEKRLQIVTFANPPIGGALDTCYLRTANGPTSTVIYPCACEYGLDPPSSPTSRLQAPCGWSNAPTAGCCHVFVGGRLSFDNCRIHESLAANGLNACLRSERVVQSISIIGPIVTANCLATTVTLPLTIGSLIR